MNINLREPSTKRGIVMLITGATILYQTFWGSGQIDIDSVLARVDWWIGICLTIVGMLGFLPDRDPEKRTRETDHKPPRQATPLPPVQPLPSIGLVGKSEVTETLPDPVFTDPNNAVPRHRRVTDAWLHDPVPSVPGFKVPPATHGGQVGWNDDH